MLPILLLVERLRVEGVRRSGDARENRESEQSRNDGLHDQSPAVLVGRALRARTLHVVSLVSAKRCDRSPVMNSDVNGLFRLASARAADPVYVTGH